MNNIQTIETYTARIQRSFPQIAIHTVVPNTRGWDSFVLEVNDELIFRFAMREDVDVRFRKEIRLLHWGHGQSFMERVLENYSGTIDSAFFQRMDFYLRYQPFSELLYGASSTSNHR